MRIGLFGNDAYSVSGVGPFDVEAIVAAAEGARADGFSSYWVGQQFDWDAFSLLAAVGRSVPDIELGTNVTHIWTAFPVHLAQQAASLHVLTGGRFTLGLGVEHDWVIRDMWGLPFDNPVSTLAEYVQIVNQLLRTGRVDFDGEHYNVHTFFARFEPAPGMQTVLGALGPRMLRLAGTVADGTSTWLTGRATVRNHIVPSIRQAAEAAGRPEPRVIVNLPIVVTDRAELEVRGEVAASMELYERMPSYRRMLDREGATSAGDVALVGTEDAVREALEDLGDAGTTDFGAIVLGSLDEREITRELLRNFAAEQDRMASGLPGTVN